MVMIEGIRKLAYMVIFISVVGERSRTESLINTNPIYECNTVDLQIYTVSAWKTTLTCANICPVPTAVGIFYPDNDATLAVFPLDSSNITFKCEVPKGAEIVEVLLKLNGTRYENIVFNPQKTWHSNLYPHDGKSQILRNISTSEYGIDVNPTSVVGPATLKISITKRDQPVLAYNFNVTNKSPPPLPENCKCTTCTGYRVSVNSYFAHGVCLLLVWLFSSINP